MRLKIRWKCLLSIFDGRLSFCFSVKFSISYSDFWCSESRKRFRSLSIPFLYSASLLEQSVPVQEFDMVFLLSNLRRRESSIRRSNKVNSFVSSSNNSCFDSWTGFTDCFCFASRREMKKILKFIFKFIYFLPLFCLMWVW